MGILILVIVAIVVLNLIVRAINEPKALETTQVPDWNPSDMLGTGTGATSDKDIPGGHGEFGMVKTNPIPADGVPNIYEYLSQLKYSFTTQKGTIIYFPVQYTRTVDSDSTSLGSSIEDSPGVSAITSASNITGNTDVFNIYDINDCKLAKIYLNGYQAYTSSNTPKGFIHVSQMSDEQDADQIIERFKALSDYEKQKICQNFVDNVEAGNKSDSWYHDIVEYMIDKD